MQSLKNMLAQLGVTVPPNVTPQLKNVAAVSVHAVLPAFVKPGQTIDITVNSIANAKSLRGGSLLVTPLHGLDGQIYAIAQGNLIVSGFGVEGTDGSKLTVNVPSSGRIPNGATVERAVPSQITQGDAIILNLNDPDFTTATRLVQSVNKGVGDGVCDHHRRRLGPGARAARTSRSASPFCRRWRICRSSPASAPARVIINSRTGTVVISSNVTVSPAAVSHGSLSVTIKEEQTRQSTRAVRHGRPDRGGHQFDHQSRSRLESHVPVQARASNWSRSCAPSTRSERRPATWWPYLEALREAGALQAELIVI